MAFGSGSRMGDRAFIGRADILRIAPQCARTVIVGSRLPVRTTLGENSLADIEVDRAVDRVDTDRIAVLDQRDRAPLSRFGADMADARSEEHTSELQSLMRISYAVFCLKKKKNKNRTHTVK